MTLRWLIRNWLGPVAYRRAAEAVAGAAGNQNQAAAQPDSHDDAAPSPPRWADVGIVFALGNEAGGLLDRLQDVVTRRGAGFVSHAGHLAGRSVVAVISGPGQPAARKAAEAMLQGHRPQWVVAAGFAGGLDPSLRRGELLLANSVVSPHGGRLRVAIECPPADGSARDRPWHTGRLLTVDRIARTPAEKHRLHRQYDAVAVDMETYATAEVCRQTKTRFLAVRVIHDTVDDCLPDEVGHLMRQKTLAGQMGAVTGTIWRRPSSVKDMWHLQQTALDASHRLAEFLEGVVKRLGDPATPHPSA